MCQSNMITRHYCDIKWQGNIITKQQWWNDSESRMRSVITQATTGLMFIVVRFLNHPHSHRCHIVNLVPKINDSNKMQAHNLCTVGLVLCVHGKHANKRLHKKIHTYTDVCPITFRTKHAMVKKLIFTLVSNIFQLISYQN